MSQKPTYRPVSNSMSNLIAIFMSYPIASDATLVQGPRGRCCHWSDLDCGNFWVYNLPTCDDECLSPLTIPCTPRVIFHCEELLVVP